MTSDENNVRLGLVHNQECIKARERMGSMNVT